MYVYRILRVAVFSYPVGVPSLSQGKGGVGGRSAWLRSGQLRSAIGGRLVRSAIAKSQGKEGEGRDSATSTSPTKDLLFEFCAMRPTPPLVHA